MFHRSILTTVASAAIAGGLIAFSFADDADEPADGGKSEIHALMLEHRDVLLDRVAAIREQHRNGRTGIDRLIAAENDVLEAKLELATSTEDRVAIRREALANHEKLEQFAKVLFDNGQGSLEASLEAKANRIRAKIALLREQASDAK